MGKVTNMFHVMYAKWTDRLRPAKPAVDQDYYSFQPMTHIPEQDIPEVRNISLPGESKMVMQDGEGYAISYDKMPEFINIPEIDKNWHPNKDSMGHYMSPNQYTNRYSFNNGYLGGYNPYYYGGGYLGGYNYTNPYSYNQYSWNVPNYRYPF
jgi:hypothetical protein